MKKFLCILLCMVTVLSTMLLTACGGNDTDKGEAKLKMGVGVVNTASVKDADGETNGSGELDVTVAAVLVDIEGKIVKCVIDTAQSKVACTSEGKAVPKEGFKTKYELGMDYGMVNSAGAEKEWFEQIDALCALIEGKTLVDALALVAEGGKGTEAVISAGCTITIDEYLKAVELAAKSAKDTDATAKCTLGLGMVTELATADATEEKDGHNQLDTSFVVSAVDASGKVVASYSDCVRAKLTFNTAGASTYDTTKPIQTKKELGESYGMASYGTDRNEDGVVKEWFEQAAAFEAACIGKTAGEISGLENGEGYGVDALQTAGCTIEVSGLVKAAVKSAKVG